MYACASVVSALPIYLACLAGDEEMWVNNGQVSELVCLTVIG